MTTVLQLGDRTFTSQEIIPLLTIYQLIPQFLCESLLDRTIASIDCTPEETHLACQQFYQHWGLTLETEQLAWRERYGLSQQQLETLATRRLKIEKFKEEKWGLQVSSYFLKQKCHLDQALYSLIRVQNKEVAHELYFRLQEEEQTFDQIARSYSEGPEAETGGLMGPVELGTLNPSLAYLLYTSPVGAVQPPIALGNWWVIVRVEKKISAQLTAQLKQRLVQAQFEAWFQEELQNLTSQEKIWMGVNPIHN